MCFFCSFLLPASLSSLWFHSFFLSVLHRVLSSFWLICLVMIISGARSRVCGSIAAHQCHSTCFGWARPHVSWVCLSVFSFVISLFLSLFQFFHSFSHDKDWSWLCSTPCFPLFIACLYVCLSFSCSLFFLFFVGSKRKPFLTQISRRKRRASAFLSLRALLLHTDSTVQLPDSLFVFVLCISGVLEFFLCLAFSRSFVCFVLSFALSVSFSGAPSQSSCLAFDLLLFILSHHSYTTWFYSSYHIVSLFALSPSVLAIFSFCLSVVFFFFPLQSPWSGSESSSNSTCYFTLSLLWHHFVLCNFSSFPFLLHSYSLHKCRCRRKWIGVALWRNQRAHLWITISPCL